MANFSQNMRRHEKLTNQPPVGRVALHNSLTRLKESGTEAMEAGTHTAKELAASMVEVYSKIGSLAIKPPLTPEQAQAISDDLRAYQSIVDGPNGPAKPTDTGAIPTGEGKGL